MPQNLFDMILNKKYIPKRELFLCFIAGLHPALNTFNPLGVINKYYGIKEISKIC